MYLTDSFKSILRLAERHQCSDLHISAGCRIYGRINGQLSALDTHVWSPLELNELFGEIATPEMHTQMKKHLNLDVACSFESYRFRINIYSERASIAFAIRRFNDALKNLEILNLPDSMLDLAQLRHGLVLFTGATGSGKSTSLAALIDHINTHRACHIITIEDPIEYVHQNKKALVHQCELGTDFTDFSVSLRETLRKDPDVILVGEMRDLETIKAAITAAETGHLVFSTLHCGDAIGALDRILSMYPPEEKESVVSQLAAVLQGVVSQLLLPKLGDSGRLPAVEILRNTPAVRNLIMNRQFNQIYNVLEVDSSQGMQCIDLVLANYVHNHLVCEDTALSAARNKKFFLQKLESLATKRSLRKQKI